LPVLLFKQLFFLAALDSFFTQSTAAVSGAGAAEQSTQRGFRKMLRLQNEDGIETNPFSAFRPARRLAGTQMPADCDDVL
jgi:hypothetical protein